MFIRFTHQPDQPVQHGHSQRSPRWQLRAVLNGTGAVLTTTTVAVSFVASYFFSEAQNKPLWEGFLALAAAIMVISMTVYMWKTARTMRTIFFDGKQCSD